MSPPILDPAGLLTGLVAAGAVSAVAWRARALTLSGALAATAIGAIIFGLGGIAWSLPLILFFIVGTLLSRLPLRPRPGDIESGESKGGDRDAAQVLANGAIPALLVLLAWLAADRNVFLLYLGSLAAAAADTSATEIGTRYGGATISLATLRRLLRGTSGGISLTGSLGGLAGGLMISLAGGWFTADPFETFAVVTAAGVIGMLVDSLFGALLQGRYSCPRCGRETERSEHCDGATRRIRGFAWCDNDVVNVACTMAGAFATMLIAWS